MSDVQDNQEGQEEFVKQILEGTKLDGVQVGEQGNVETSSEQSSGDQGTKAPDQAPLTPDSETSTTPKTDAETSDTTASDTSTSSANKLTIDSVAAQTSAADAQASSAAAQAAAVSAASAAAAATALLVTPASTTDNGTAAASLAQTTPTVAQTTPNIAAGTLVSGSVIDNKQPVIAPSSMPPEVPVAPIAPAAPAVTFIQSGISEVDQIVEGLMKNTSIEAKLLINAIKEYIVTMKPGKIVSIKDGTRQQVSLYNTFLSAINNLEGDFRPTMQSILALLHAHKDGAFKETHVFRFVEHIPLSADHRKGFQKVTTLLKTLANPTTRQDMLRQINFDPVTKYGLTDRGRTKLAAFFGK